MYHHGCIPILTPFHENYQPDYLATSSHFWYWNLGISICPHYSTMKIKEIFLQFSRSQSGAMRNPPYIHGKPISQQSEDNERRTKLHTEHGTAMIYRLENQLSICQMRRKRGRCKCLCDSAFFLLWVWFCYHPSMDILFGKEFPSLISKYFSSQSPGVHLTLKTDMCCRWRRSAFVRSRNLSAIDFLCSCGLWVLNAKHKFEKKINNFWAK